MASGKLLPINKRRFQAITAGAVIAVLVCWGAIAWLRSAAMPIHLNKDVAIPVVKISQLDVALLRDADIVLRQGRDIVSHIILSQGESTRFSHVGLVFRRGDQLLVIHAMPAENNVPGGVEIEPFAVFAAADKSTDVAFYRARDLSESAQVAIRDFAFAQIGKPFDEQFLLSDSNKLYCTELVLDAFEAAGLSLGETVPHMHVMMLAEAVVPPDYLRQSALLEKIDLDFK